MSQTQYNSHYHPVSDDKFQKFPMVEVKSDVHKQQHTARPAYHAIDNRPPSLMSRIIHDWWTIEILAWFAALGSMVVMLLVLRKYDQRPQSDWPFAITVNAFLQLFTTTLRSALLIPVAQSISQLKWTWFLRNDRALEDFATFDNASRGIWGSLCLIWHQKAARLASLGALITIMTLATSTFVQQAVSFPARPTATGNGTAVTTLNTYYTDAEGFYDVTGAAALPVAAIKGAFYNGLLRQYYDKVQHVVPTCSTGNCTWPLYSSLAVCSSVSNVTADLKKHTGGDEDVTLTLSNGDKLSHGTDETTLSISDDLNARVDQSLASFNRSSIAFGNVQNPLADISVISFSPQSAVECVLEFCVQTLNTSVSDGIATTSVVKSQTALSLGNDWTLFNGSVTPSNADLVYTLTVPSSGGEVNYSVAVNTMLALQTWIGKRLPGSSGRWDLASSDSTDTIGSAMSGDYVANMGSLMDNIAIAMTNTIRTTTKSTNVDGLNTNSTNVNGTAYENVVYIHVEWKLLGFPIALLVLSFVFLTATIIKNQFSSVGIWKASTFATMQVLSEETRRELGPLNTNARMKKLAGARDVRLRNVGDGWGFQVGEIKGGCHLVAQLYNNILGAYCLRILKHEISTCVCFVA